MSRAAGPQCQHVRGMPWSLRLTGGTSVPGALCLGMDQGVWCRWTVRVACLWLFGASSRMVGGVQRPADGVGSSCVVLPSFGASCSLARGRGCLRQKALYAVSKSLGPGLRSACAEVRLEDAACWPLRVRRERGVVGVALGHDLHLRWGDLYYGDGASQRAQGVHPTCRVSVDVRGHEWPLLIAVVVRQDGVRVVRWEELQLGPDAGAHRGGDTVLCQYRPRAGVAGHLRFFYAYGGCFANLGSVVVCHPV